MTPISFRWIVDAADGVTPMGEPVPAGVPDSDPRIHLATRVHELERRLPQSEADIEAKRDVVKVSGFVVQWAQDPSRVRQRLEGLRADSTLSAKPVVTDGLHVYTAAEALALLRGVFDEVSLVGSEFP